MELKHDFVGELLLQFALPTGLGGTLGQGLAQSPGEDLSASAFELFLGRAYFPTLCRRSLGEPITSTNVGRVRQRERVKDKAKSFVIPSSRPLDNAKGTLDLITALSLATNLEPFALIARQSRNGSEARRSKALSDESTTFLEGRTDLSPSIGMDR